MKKTYGLITTLIIVVLMTGCNGTVGVDIAPDSPTGDLQNEKTVQESAQNKDKSDTENDLQVAKDITPLAKEVASPDGLGEDAVFGACINSANIEDEKLMDIVTKHFNAVTLENELKPDALFGYSNEKAPGLHEEEYEGQKISVPTLDFSRADRMLDKILEINEKRPDNPIRVRGHVLVWHSQTPEWFFHEDYDAKKEYVLPEEMNKRLEWYIRSVLEHYTSDESRYRQMFYGWDVVNEAISDRTGTYRTDTETGSDALTDPVHDKKSSWWKVYGSNEYIINAFRFANRYAPEDIDLYYNDYNECDDKKLKGISALIEEVKAADGTRLNGFGMQGHYTVNAPTTEQIEEAARKYASLGVKVMLTELDVKASMFYDGTEEALPKEYDRQAEYFGSIYDTFRKLKREGVDISGISFWGVCDKYTWLEGQHPLLFDTDYNPKSACYRFVSNPQ